MNDVENAQGGLAGRVNVLESNSAVVADLEAQVAALEASVATLQATVTALQGQVDNNTLLANSADGNAGTALAIVSQNARTSHLSLRW